MEISVDRALIALETIERADPEDLIRGLNAVFNQIVKMDEGQTIAAWQTLDFCAARFPLGSEKHRIIEKFQEVIVNRMSVIARTSPYSWASKAFADVTGREFSR